MSIIFFILTLLFSLILAAPISTQEMPTNSVDEEVTADIDAIHAQLESYYARNGDYPTENELYFEYDTELAGLDQKHLIDPDGRIIGNASRYEYAPSKCTALGCGSYELYATLDNGTTYEKVSLN